MPVLRARAHLPRPNMLARIPTSPSPAIKPAPLLLSPSTQRPVAVGSTPPLPTRKVHRRPAGSGSVDRSSPPPRPSVAAASGSLGADRDPPPAPTGRIPPCTK
ncbi:hypothetical protein ZWY2020_016260 [Hordeum vulgare]|nr:hypothetical protein ZWY2020_016260 [Hordeum vulgare]